MKCMNCKKIIEDDAVWCRECGTETGIIGEKFSARMALKTDWLNFKSTHCYPFAIFYVLAILLPIGAGAVFTAGNYWLNNLVMLALVPFALIPFGIPVAPPDSRLTTGAYVKNLGRYPHYLALVFFAEAYFLALKVICTGKPLFFFAADPILHLVRLVMVLYGLAILMPALSLEGMSPLRALWTAYKGCADTRWQQFFVVFLLFVANLIAVIPLGLGLLVTVPFTFYAVRCYTTRLTRFSPFKRYLPITPAKSE